MHDGFLRVASATPTIQVANCPYNAQQIIAVAKQAAEKQVIQKLFIPKILRHQKVIIIIMLIKKALPNATHKKA